ncbi:hypothetical protein SHKM778_59660 [Streptomyces sp. KM77-8]|uniref:DZIP3-like HEPN domain-containing protein n=1 Tax=Streptomyces haneummycinicus TaxID=3074435 RepID=A0AAT9HQ57_9ACTN
MLSFHDAVELFLVLAGEHLGVGLPTQINFSQYWEKLAAGLPPNTQLPSKKAMERMNKLRVNLKHHGAVPSPTDIDQVRADVLTFFTDATPIIFGGSFTQIDMIDLVSRPQTVKFLQFAQSCADKEICRRRWRHSRLRSRSSSSTTPRLDGRPTGRRSGSVMSKTTVTRVTGSVETERRRSYA